MDKFYVLKLICANGTRGYVIDDPKEILLASSFTAAVKQFKTYQDAQQFMRDKKLERNGTKAYIRDNEDIMKEGGPGLSPALGDMYYLTNLLDHKLFYDTKEKGYYFDTPDVGYCIWYSEEEVKDFVEKMQFEEKTVIKKLEKKQEPKK